MPSMAVSTLAKLDQSSAPSMRSSQTPSASSAVSTLMWSIPLSAMGLLFLPLARAGLVGLASAAFEQLPDRLQERLLLERLQEELRAPFEVLDEEVGHFDLARHEEH